MITFIRTQSITCTPDHYQESTDVWVFGTVEGYREFADLLRSAMNAAEPCVARAHAQDDNSMQVVILPARKYGKKARLKCIERVVCLHGEAGMELIIVGNAQGYEWLARVFETQVTKCTDRPHEHWHVDDDYCEALLKRSVYLNIRGPVSDWSRENMPDHWHLVHNRLPTYVPSGLGHMMAADDPYEPIDAHARCLSLE